MRDMKEIWKPIINYEEKYEISNLGNVKSLPKRNGHRLSKEMILKSNKRPNGYYVVCLSKDKKTKNYYIHRLVAQAFISNPQNYKEVNHKDGNKQNNNVDNLEWCSRKQNIDHALKNGLRIMPKGEQVYNARKVYQYALDGKLIKIWKCVADIAREFNISASNIICCCLNKPKYKTSHGYIWKYEEDNNGKNNS